MKLVLRVYGIAAAFAWSVGDAIPADTAANMQQSDLSVQRWMNGWVEEACRQCTPIPQLLYIPTRPWEDYPLRSVESDGRINVTSGFRDLYNSNFGYRYKIFQIGGAHWVRKVEFILRSVVWDVPDEEFGAFSRDSDIFSSRLPVFSLRSPKAYGGGFHWLKNVRVPSTTHPMAVFLAQFTDANPFKLNTQSTFPNTATISGCLNSAFLTSVTWYSGGASSTILIHRWSPPDLDEMFSTPLPPSR